MSSASSRSGPPPPQSSRSCTRRASSAGTRSRAGRSQTGEGRLRRYDVIQRWSCVLLCVAGDCCLYHPVSCYFMADTSTYCWLYRLVSCLVCVLSCLVNIFLKSCYLFTFNVSLVQVISSPKKGIVQDTNAEEGGEEHRIKGWLWHKRWHKRDFPHRSK